MENQKQYWDDAILDWEDYTYGEAKPRRALLVEKAARWFRGPNRRRRRLAMQIVREAKPENVLELGCGSGGFAISMATQTSVRRVTGVDVSEQAIRVARKRAVSVNLSHKLSFIQSSVADLDFDKLKPFDFVVGLGLTPYLHEEEFDHLFRSVSNTSFFFDVHRKGFTFLNLAHALYRRIKQHPFYVQYSEKEIVGKLVGLGISDVKWKHWQGVYYIRH